MKEAIVSKGLAVEIVDSPIPEPNNDQVLIKVVVSGSNPKDWKITDFVPAQNTGDDIAGVVEKVGKNVHEFKPGDRVAAFHEMMTPHGSFAEYAIAWAHTTFRIPPKISFEEAAAIPLAAMTSARGLFHCLNLPHPWTPATEAIPLVIYGAASSVGAYAIQLAARANIHPLICVAGASVDYVETLIDRSRGDTIIDYRAGADAVVAGLQAALAGRPLLHAFDAVSEHGSYLHLSRVLASEGATISLVLPGRKYDGIPAHVRQTQTMVGAVHQEDPAFRDFGYVYFRYFTRGLEEGWLKAQPQEVVPGGLGGVQTALQNLKAGKARGVKYVFRIADTEGVAKSLVQSKI